MIIYFVYLIILILHIIQYEIQINYFAEIFEFINSIMRLSDEFRFNYYNYKL